MFNKMSTQAAIFAVAALTSASTIYNTERSISASKSIVTDKISQLENKLDLLSNQLNKLANNESPSPESPSLPVNLDTVKETSIISTDLFNDLTNTPATFSVSIILFVIAAFSALTGLLINFYINQYGKEWLSKVPTYLKPLINHYLKITPYTGYFNIMIIGVCLLLILLVAIYMKFRGIA